MLRSAIVDADATASGVVIGAPGTGKTTALVDRVVHLLATGLRPEEVLALTPNRQAATSLRDRIGVLVDQATPGPLARSVGSFAFQLVRGAMVHAGEEPPALLTGADQDRIIAELLAGDAEDGAWTTRCDGPTRSDRRCARRRASAPSCAPSWPSAPSSGCCPVSCATRATSLGRPPATSSMTIAMCCGMLRSAYRDAADLLSEAVGILHGADAAELGPWLRCASC